MQKSPFSIHSSFSLSVSTFLLLLLLLLFTIIIIPSFPSFLLLSSILPISHLHHRSLSSASPHVHLNTPHCPIPPLSYSPTVPTCAGQDPPRVRRLRRARRRRRRTSHSRRRRRGRGTSYSASRRG